MNALLNPGIDTIRPGNGQPCVQVQTAVWKADVSWPQQLRLASDPCHAVDRATVLPSSVDQVVCLFMNRPRELRAAAANLRPIDSMQTRLSGCIQDRRYSNPGVIARTVLLKPEEPEQPVCFNNCSGHGRCVDYACKCDAGYDGDDCSFCESRVSTMRCVLLPYNFYRDALYLHVRARVYAAHPVSHRPKQKHSRRFF